MTKPAKNSLSALGRFWTIPNILSMARLVLIIPVTWLIVVDGPLWWIMMLLLLAVATDYFDGRVARWSDQVSEWGKVLDPLADKFGGGFVVAALTYIGSLPLWFFLVLAVRDLSILAGGEYLRYKTGHIVASIWIGKIAVTGVAVTALAALLKADEPVLQFCIWTTVILLVYSFARYFVRFFAYLRGAPIESDQD